MPTAAVRSGSSAALSRMFQPAWRIAASATQPRAIGSTPRCYRPGRWRRSRSRRRPAPPGRPPGRGVSARCRASRSPSPPSSSPPTRDHDAGRHPDPVPAADHRLAEVRRQRELVDPVRPLERRRQEVDDEGQDHDRRDDLGGERGADDAADRQPDPGQRERVQAEHDGARHRRHDVEPGQRRADPDPAARSPRSSGRSRRRRRGRSRAPSGRGDIGVDSSVSSRPPVSSVAQPLTSVAAANPTRINPNVMNASWRNAPAPLRSRFGNRSAVDRLRVGRQVRNGVGRATATPPRR